MIRLPTVYLSPSTQEFNQYFSGGNEEYYMNLLADVVQNDLERNGINVVRNNPVEPLAEAIMASNRGNYDLHLALHSNAAPLEFAGKLQGPDIYYYPGSVRAKEFADILARNMKEIYPNPRLVNVRSTKELGELQFTKAPAVLVEVAYHDNPSDEMWIKENLDTIGNTIAESVAEFLGVSYIGR